jgi:hypothetical protein
MEHQQGEMMLTAERLRELLAYDPETGVFTRRVQAARGRGRAGDVAGWVEPDGYVRIRLDGRKCRAHRLAWLYMTGKWPNDQIDHINGRTGDNRWVNLRAATHSENQCNRPLQLNNSTGYKGVYPYRGAWRARIKKGGRFIHIGTFATAEAAHVARSSVLAEHHGDFARPE